MSFLQHQRALGFSHRRVVGKTGFKNGLNTGPNAPPALCLRGGGTWRRRGGGSGRASLVARRRTPRTNGSGPDYCAYGFDFTRLRSREERVARLDALATLLDTAFMLPGTNVRFGFDALVGLVPGIGDAITT